MTHRPVSVEATPQNGDGGFTLIEILVVMIVTGTLLAALAMAASITLRTTPSTEDRLDDARSTRNLATWLSHDTTSTPPFLGEQAQGGVILMANDPVNSNDCGAAGDNLVHMQWTATMNTSRTYVANYRYSTEDGIGLITRHTCSKTGADPFVSTGQTTVITGLTATQLPIVTVDLAPSGDISRVKFELVGNGGETVRVDTSSRNPADFFP